MKSVGTLKFFSVIVAALAFLCLIFPSDGIQIGDKKLRFPKLHNVLVREKEKSIDELLVKKEERDLSGFVDSLADCHNVLFESQIRLWLPNNDITCFDRLFESAETAVKKRRIVRILHYGDSQIEQDRITSTLRNRLQEQFGGGGPGMLPLRQSVAAISFNQSTSGSLVGQSSWGDSTFVRAKGNYGPMLRSWRINGTATMSISASSGKYASQRTGHFSSVKVLFNNRPGPLTVSMRDRKGGGTFQDSQSRSGISLLEWKMDSSTTKAAITLNGNSDIYGILVDDGYGVAVDNIGMRGASGHQFKMVNADQLAESYRLLDVGLIIMQFGGNSVPYLKTNKAINDYCDKIGSQIDFIRNACPQAAILFIGPSDMGRQNTYPKLTDVVEQLRVTATSHGAAFWSIYDAMGGKGSMATWNKNNLAGPDYIHFSLPGAKIIGDYLSDALLKFYQLYLMRKQLTTEQFNTLWSQVSSPEQQN